MDELIVVRQLPVIEEQLRTIQAQIEERVSEALAMDCTEETVKQVKAIRGALSKDYQDLEDRRKEIKNQILKPYDCFELVYKECVTNIYKPADAQLKAKVDAVEDGLKQQKRAEVEAYFEEYRISKEIHFVSFADAGIEIHLSGSKKSYKDRCKAFIDKVAEELELIRADPNAAEVLVEYRKTLNAAQAITTVRKRQEAIEMERKRVQQAQEVVRQREAAAQRVEAVIQAEAPPLAAPIATPMEEIESEPNESQNEAEPLLQLTFTVVGTKEKLRALKVFLQDGGYQYE